ncbi:MFS transporter [Candidatus Formimonas warabiya]|uniref:Putative proline/betaine transporter n=1 Tax=Formimonas warabiya TaxID=1761012 RepID=A0A3G1KW01_FORW1|nr:MFS transporter [Candidatus Formimonas warabiya]ATW26611.1 MFS transporter [Candidatus Formimonas warabiya]
MSTPELAINRPQKSSKMKTIVGGTIGNVLEWFDYGLYGYFAAVISANFFQSKDPLTALMLTFAVFGVGFVMRPFGGIVFGHLADKAGRRTTLSATVVMMGLGTFIVGCLPTADQVGVLAPILLVTCRLLQGMATGGEWGTCTSFLAEYATPFNRGYIVSWASVTMAGGLLLGSLCGVLLSNLMSQEALYSWGWRIPFMSGLIIAIYGYYIRRGLEETPVFEKAVQNCEVSKSPLIEVLQHHRKELLALIFLIAGATTSYWLILTYMTTFIIKILELPATTAFGLNSLLLITYMICLPFFGMLTDRIGRKKQMLIAYGAFALLDYPLFSILSSTSNLAVMIFVIEALGIILAMAIAAGMPMVAEMFPTRVRASGFGIGYNIGQALFGGTCTFIVTWLIKATGNPNSVAIYLVILVLITFFDVLLFIPESYRKEF